MQTKLIYLTLLAFILSLSASAQLEGKKFSANLEGIGEINLQFKEKVYELSNSAAIVLVKGNYKTEDKEITFTDMEGPIACPKEVNGEYEFLYKDGVLKLTLIQDACPGRKNIGATTWKEAD